MLAGLVLTSTLPSGRSGAAPTIHSGEQPARARTALGLAAPVLQRWWPAAAAVVGGSVAIDTVGQLLHLPLMAAGAGAAGLLLVWSWRRAPVASHTSRSTDVAGWLLRLERLLNQFDLLEADLPRDSAAQSVAVARHGRLEQLRAQSLAEGLQLAMVGSVPVEAPWRQAVASTLQGTAALTLHWSRPLPSATGCWHWPEPFASSDLLVYCLRPPLLASDLRWLQALPAGQPLWILLLLPAGGEAQAAERELRNQIPAELPLQLLCLHDGDSVEGVLQPLAAQLAQDGSRLRRQCRERCLEAQHRCWQADLETLRRSRLRVLQQRTQWIVAAAVVAAPLPSLDLLVLAVANGLMVKEMARLWDCPWSAEQLRATALELARASLLLGLVEWTGQALATVVKWHGATWLLGSTVQALSAAYLTRVVSHAMADTLARSVGVTEPDLERIRREAPLLVARAAEQERLDWQGFVQQGRRWLVEQAAGGAMASPAVASRAAAELSAPA